MRSSTPAPTGLAGLRAKVSLHARKLLRATWPVYSARDWQPAHDLRPALVNARHYESMGGDPHFRLGETVPAGWYMLEMKLRLPLAFAEAKLYLDTGSGESEAGAVPLRLRSERLSKRLVHVPAPARLRLDPFAMPGRFELQHLRLVKVGTQFARKRMQMKLVARHPQYGRRAQDKVATVEQIWTDYCKLFEPGSELVSYAEWISHAEQPRLPTPAAQQAEIASWSWKPGFSVVMPTYNTDPAMLKACLDSVLAQSYPHWELCIADDASTVPAVRALLERYARRDARIKLVFRPQNGHIVAASNSALELATQEFVALLDHDDELPAHALFMVARALQERPGAQLVYSDEDKLDAEGKRCAPFFKPDFSPDLLYSQNYFSHFGVYRRSLIEAVGGFRPGYEGSQDYDLVLRCVARVSDPRDVLHVPQVLYHWRMAEGSTAGGHEQKSYASEAGRRALQDYFDSRNEAVTVSVRAPGIYRHKWALPDGAAPLVSLIVPTRDGYDILKKCLDSILALTSYPHYEVLVVDNQSTCPLTLSYLRGLESAGRIRVLRYDYPFNYSAINNFAARQARGSVIGLINNDVEVINPDWLDEMVSHAMRPDIGCVGAKLYYPNDTLQHGGVVCGLGGVANHAHRHFPRSSPGYFGRLWTIHNLSAVTAAVLLLRKEIFDEVGGLDEAGLTVAFNDVDLCLKVMQAGYRNLWTPYAELYHHESVSRGSDETPEKRQRFQSECAVMHQRWATLLARDPYYNPNLTREREDYSLNTAAEGGI